MHWVLFTNESNPKRGNFNLRKWISNCAEIMEKINSFEEQEFGEKIVHIDKFHKVLGILWNFEIDELFFDLKNVVSESQISAKHEFLKVLSSVCDPLGVVSPTTDWFRCTTRTAVNNGWHHVWKYFASCFINSKNIVSKDLYVENKLGRCTTWKNNCLVGKYSWKCKRYEFFKIVETLFKNVWFGRSWNYWAAWFIRC